MRARRAVVRLAPAVFPLLLRRCSAAVARTSSPAMRDELLTIANSTQFINILR